MPNKPQLQKLSYNQTVRLTDDIATRLNTAAEKLGMAKQDVVRMATDIGLAHLENVKYDLAKCVLNSSAKK